MEESVLESFLDKSQMDLQSPYDIRKTQSYYASDKIPLNLSSITTFSLVSDGKLESLVVIGTMMGNLLYVDKGLNQIEKILSLPQDESNDQHVTALRQINQINKNIFEKDKDSSSTLLIGTNRGQLYLVINNQFFKSTKEFLKDQIIDLQMDSDKAWILYNYCVIFLDYGNRIIIDIPSEKGQVTQVQMALKLNKILISTSLFVLFIFDLQTKELLLISDRLENVSPRYYVGCSFDPIQLKIYSPSHDNKLQLFNGISQALELKTGYAGKKFKEIQFGHFYLDHQKLISINPKDSIVIIDLQTKKPLAYESLTDFDFHHYCYQDGSLYLLGQTKDGNSKLILQEISLINLQQGFKQLVTLNKIKKAIKLCLKQKSLQDLQVLQELLMKLFRKEQKPELKERKEYKFFTQIVETLEKQKRNSVHLGNSTQAASSVDDKDEGFGKLEEAQFTFEAEYGQENKTSSVSEILLRQKSEFLQAQKRIDQEKQASRLYKQNKKIKKQLKQQKQDTIIEKIILPKLLLLSLPRNLAQKLNALPKKY